jgi:hypothetical protein
MSFKNRLFTSAVSAFLFFLPLCIAYGYMHPAELRIVNASQRALTVKVMKRGSGNEAAAYATVAVGGNANKTISIGETGHYYLKTKAQYSGKEPIYKKGDPFNVCVGSDGYSVLTITFSIQENSLPDPMSGSQISKTEFDKDSE